MQKYKTGERESKQIHWYLMFVNLKPDIVKILLYPTEIFLDFDKLIWKFIENIEDLD
jgi:hypothetical protein